MIEKCKKPGTEGKEINISNIIKKLNDYAYLDNIIKANEERRIKMEELGKNAGLKWAKSASQKDLTYLCNSKEDIKSFVFEIARHIKFMPNDLYTERKMDLYIYFLILFLKGFQEDFCLFQFERDSDDRIVNFVDGWLETVNEYYSSVQE